MPGCGTVNGRRKKAFRQGTADGREAAECPRREDPTHPCAGIGATRKAPCHTQREHAEVPGPLKPRNDRLAATMRRGTCHSGAATRVGPISDRPESRRRLQARPRVPRGSRADLTGTPAHLCGLVLCLSWCRSCCLLSTCPSWQCQPAMASFHVLAGIRGPPAVVTATGSEIRRQSRQAPRGVGRALSRRRARGPTPCGIRFHGSALAVIHHHSKELRECRCGRLNRLVADRDTARYLTARKGSWARTQGLSNS